MPSKRNRQPWPVAGPSSPVTWMDLVSILDTNGIVLSSHGKGRRSREAKLVRRLFKAWVEAQGIRPDLAYVMPLRALSETLSREHPHLIHQPTGGVSWSLVVDAVNDPYGGLIIVRRRFAANAA